MNIGYYRCSICGQKDHRMLEQITDENGKTKLEYCCPISYNTNWETSRDIPKKTEKYRACPRKFAENCGFNKEEVDKAFILYVRGGNGRYEGYKNNSLFKKEIDDICDEVRNSWTFKR